MTAAGRAGIGRWARLAALALAVGSRALAADAPQVASTEQPRLTVPRVPRAPTLDDFLGMAPPHDLREHLARVRGFVQRQPEDGKPASQETDVYLGYDQQHLYVVFVAFDADPQKIRAHVSRRENVFGDETVEVQIDTFNDQRRAYSFLTNPFGIQWDAIWTEGQGFDSSWDTVWHSRGELTDRGYVVWMAIPFKSLRFPRNAGDGSQLWRLVFVRDIPRNNETSFWPRVSSRIEGRLNQAATANGVAGVSPGRNLWLIPYATARTFRIEDELGRTTADRDGLDAGVDVKWVLQDRLALDVTANPDFSQVESDEPQVTVNERFEVFFPEKRPFFLENADYFNTRFNLLFTRRIADPRAGARLTGKVGAYSLGALLIDDEAPGKFVDVGDPLRGASARNGVLRVQRDVSRQSNVGLMYTDRELEDGYNRVASLDARIKLDDNWDSRAQAAYATTRTIDGAELADPAYSLEFNRDGRTITSHLHYQEVGPEFRTELGFVPRVDIRDLHANVDYNVWIEGPRLIRWQPSLFLQRIEDHDGTRLDEVLGPGLELELRRSTAVGLFGRVARERLRPQDSPGLRGERDFSVSNIGGFFNTHWIAPLELEIQYQQGRTINFRPALCRDPACGPGDLLPPEAAERRFAEVELTLRPIDRLRIDGTLLYTRLDDRASGAEILTDEILRIRFGWQFDAKLSLRAILQRDSTEVDPARTSVAPRKNWNGDLLLTYLVNPWTALYVGYNSNARRFVLDPGVASGRVVFDDAYRNDARQVFVKLSYLFRP